MKSYFFESAELSSVQSLLHIKNLISQEKQAVQISYSPLFDGEYRISILANQLLHWQVSKHLDQLYFEHIRYIYSLFDLENSILLSNRTHQFFEQIEQIIENAKSKGKMKKKNQEECIHLLRELSKIIVSNWLQNELNAAEKFKEYKNYKIEPIKISV